MAAPKTAAAQVPLRLRLLFEGMRTGCLEGFGPTRALAGGTGDRRRGGAARAVAAPAAQAATTTCSGTGTISAGDYMIQANEWNSSAQQCITYTGGTAWSVTTANFNLSGGAPATYPSIYKGCHWGAVHRRTAGCRSR